MNNSVVSAFVAPSVVSIPPLCGERGITMLNLIISQFSTDVDYAHDFNACKSLFDACVALFGGEAYEKDFLDLFCGLSSKKAWEYTAPGRVFGLPNACAYCLYEIRQQLRRGPEVFSPEYSCSNVTAVAPRLLSLLNSGSDEFVTIRGEHGRSVVVPATDRNRFLSDCFARYNRRYEAVRAARRAADDDWDW